MEGIACSKYIGAVTLIFLLWNVLFANAQAGFLSIDCGGKGNRTDPETNIKWATDDNFIDVGSAEYVDLNDTTYLNNHSVPFYLRTYRVFPKPLNKSCYQLPLTPNLPHLLRVSFNGGSFSSGFQGFNYSIEALDLLYMKNLIFDAEQTQQVGENILVSSGKVLYICLIRTSESGYPFISAIELRILLQGMYNMVKVGTLLHSIRRYDFGGAENLTRYPEDRFDRLWYPFSFEGTQNVSSAHPISVNNTLNFPPSIVMQTAVFSNMNSVSFSLEMLTTHMSVVILYFAELNQSATRSFSVIINNEIRVPKINLEAYFSAIELPLQYNGTADAILTLMSNSNYSPIINACETYGVVPTQPATSSKDVEALHIASTEFKLKNWTSDPCFGIPWEGIRCSKNSKNDIRILEINLSGKKLRGTIPTSFSELTEVIFISLNNNYLSGPLPNLSNLTKLERLHLQNNRLNGTVPDWLSQLHNLKELLIGNNNFSGVIPHQLTDRSGDNLTLLFSGNKYLCGEKGYLSPSKRRLDRGVALGIAGGGIVTIFLVGICLYRVKFRSACTPCSNLTRSNLTPRSNLTRNYSMVLVPNTSKSRAFTLDEMFTATENFKHEIGRGGFGSVYSGILPDGMEIAVKVLTLFSKGGIDQFLNEVDLLSKINHKKLVSLLGYCNESKDLMLVYEYMSGGSLSDNLYNPQPSKYTHLDWKTRLKIALDAALGLEYLHVGCTSKIIHRDVKTANILLDSDLNGKLADFGLSRVTINGEASQINTTIKGTPGYLDPKYYQTHILTDKSDVYSFGVVLLELMCGRKPIDINLSQEKILLTEWVPPHVGVDNDPIKIVEMVDRRLGNHYNMQSMSHVAKLACRCIASEPLCRPTMSEVVLDIKEAITYEIEDYGVTDEVPHQ